MKKTLCLIFTIILCLSVVGCVSIEYEDTTKTYEIGDSTKSTSEKFEMTLTRAEIVDAVSLDKSSEDVFMPLSTEEANKNPEYALIKSNGYVIISYSLEYNFIGEEKYSDYANLLGVPTVIYNNEYKFSDKYFSIVANKTNHMWLGLSSDCYDNALDAMPGLKNLVFVPRNYQYEPLSDIKYEVRGFIVVPDKVANNDKPLSIVFDKLGKEYKIR